MGPAGSELGQFQHSAPVWRPWEAPAPTLAASGVELGATYPYRCVDLSESRRRALAEYRALGRQP